MKMWLNSNIFWIKIPSINRANPHLSALINEFLPLFYCWAGWGPHCGFYKSSSNISYLNSCPPPFSFIHPYSWNSFNRYHFSIYIHVNIVFALYSPSHILFPSPPPLNGTNFPPGRTFSALLFSNFVKRKKKLPRLKSQSFFPSRSFLLRVLWFQILNTNRSEKTLQVNDRVHNQGSSEKPAWREWRSVLAVGMDSAQMACGSHP
jgi:hypothetical protein